MLLLYHIFLFCASASCIIVIKNIRDAYTHAKSLYARKTTAYWTDILGRHKANEWKKGLKSKPARMAANMKVFATTNA